jgi:hypothetical protein
MNIEEIKHAVENRIGVSPDEISEAMLREAGLQCRVYLLPESFNERATYMADVLVQMLGIGSPIKGDLRVVSGSLCQALSYLVNSASWCEGKLHDFDLDEIRRKVGRLRG